MDDANSEMEEVDAETEVEVRELGNATQHRGGCSGHNNDYREQEANPGTNAVIFVCEGRLAEGVSASEGMQQEVVGTLAVETDNVQGSIKRARFSF